MVPDAALALNSGGEQKRVRRTLVALLLRDPGRPHLIRNQRNGYVLADRIVCAFDSKSRRLGLLTYKSLDKGQAMLIAPTSAIHTCFMRFPIDVAFVTRGGRILKARRDVAPWRVAIALRAFAVVELPAGTLSRCDTFAGDELVIEPIGSSDQGKTKLRPLV